MTDIVSLIDRAVGCQTCEGNLDGSVSDDFCSEDCQTHWHAHRVGAEPDSQYEHFRQRYALAMDPAGEVGYAYQIELGSSDVFVAPIGTLPPSGAFDNDGIWRSLGAGAVLDETHVFREGQMAEFNRYQQAMREHVETMATVVGPAFVAVGEACRSAITAVQAVHELLVEAGVVEKPLSVDRQARALALRKRRNTGPQRQQRAPRAINPRSTR